MPMFLYKQWTIRWSELKNAARFGAPLELNPENFSYQGPLTLHYRDRTGMLLSETVHKTQGPSKAVLAYFPHVPAHVKSREDTAATLQRRIFHNSTVRTWFLKHSDKIKSSEEKEEEEDEEEEKEEEGSQTSVAVHEDVNGRVSAPSAKSRGPQKPACHGNQKTGNLLHSMG